MNKIDLGNGIVLTSDQIQKLVSSYPDVFSKYYNDYKTNSQADATSAANQLQQNYGTNIKGLQENYATDVNDLNDKEGINGTWASTGRAERMNNLTNKYNNLVTQASQGLTGKLNDVYRNAESDIGNVNTISPTTYGNLGTDSTYKPLQQSTSQYKYNPFNLYGKVNYNQNDNLSQLNSGRLQAMNYNPLMKNNSSNY